MYEREKTLWEKKIAAEQDYLKAAGEAADARIALRLAEQKLHALGFSQEYLDKLPQDPEESYIIYEIVAPIEGTIIEKHITRGEVFQEDSQPFVIADLSDVWVNVNIHQKDLPYVKTGQQAVLKTDHELGEGVVSYVSPVVHENTRTALARIILPNDSGRWRPGSFAMADICIEEVDGKVVVPREAVVAHEDMSLVFVPAEEGFLPQPVEPGRGNEEWVEIVSGLEPGQNYVARGAFTLKSEMVKSTEDPCGGH
ncbi:MAG: Cobalt-zinc-cadmium resistance protein CzcB [Planctomycetes bacterium ADurb.Bin412]|nr:MAG: Cobalt-zinc-cadmium resistance protein CzcB [Planctomycetes bacterium ADurb.Bin412]